MSLFADAANGQRRQIRIGGQNGVVIGGGQGVVIGGSRGVQFGGGQGARFGPTGRGVQFGGGQGLAIGPQYRYGMQQPQTQPQLQPQMQYGVPSQYPQPGQAYSVPAYSGVNYPNGQAYQVPSNMTNTGGQVVGQPTSGYANSMAQPSGNLRQRVGGNFNAPLNPGQNFAASTNQAPQIQGPRPNLAQPASFDRTTTESNRLKSSVVNATASAAVASVPPKEIVLRYPNESRRSLFYTVNGSNFQLSPGNSLRMKAGQTWKIGVKDGRGKRREYLLDEPKEYVFEKSGSGWVLDASEVSVQPPAELVTKPLPSKTSSTKSAVPKVEHAKVSQAKVSQAKVKPASDSRATQVKPQQPTSILEFNDSDSSK